MQNIMNPTKTSDPTEITEIIIFLPLSILIDNEQITLLDLYVQEKKNIFEKFNVNNTDQKQSDQFIFLHPSTLMMRK